MNAFSRMSAIYFLFLSNYLIVPTDCLVVAATKNLTNHSATTSLHNQLRYSTRVKQTNFKSFHLEAFNEDSMDVVNESPVPKVFFVLNAGTKWLVSIACTVGVLWNPKSYRGPYIVVGSIACTYLAKKLKKWINQGRPEGAPFTDPGMPSSHALVSFFVAMAWNTALGGSITLTPWMLGSALMVSVLRVVCGYHTVPQIAVGGLMGIILGHAWSSLGTIVNAKHQRTTLIVAWSTYIVGSLVYIKKEVLRWFMDEKIL